MGASTTCNSSGLPNRLTRTTRLHGSLMGKFLAMHNPRADKRQFCGCLARLPVFTRSMGSMERQLIKLEWEKNYVIDLDQCVDVSCSLCGTWEVLARSPTCPP